MQKALETNEQEDFQAYKEMLDGREELTTLRDLLRIKKGTPIPLDDVEPLGDIMKRFTTGAMSLGALSPEAR